MAEIHGVSKLTDEKFLNLYAADGVNGRGVRSRYLIASRAKRTEDLKAVRGGDEPDAVAIYCLYGENHEFVVLEKQYRYPLNGPVYEFPAGLIDPGETPGQAAVRELYEETGLTFRPLSAGKVLEAARYSSPGMTDESVTTVFGYADGTVSDAHLEPTEEIRVVLADRKEALRILREERVDIRCAYQLMHFVTDEDPFAFVRRLTEAP